MNNFASNFLLEQLPYLAPRFVICFIAIVLALTHWRTSRLPAILTICGASLMMTVSVTSAIAYAWILNQQSNGNGVPTVEQLRICSILETALHSIGFGLIVLAIFAGRRPAESHDD